jgi:hypothetical protein
MHSEELKPWNVDRICGRVEFVHRIRDKTSADTYSEQRKTLRGVQLGLSEAGDHEDCCDGLKSVAAVTSGKNGRFEFKQENPGHYWLTANWNGKSYKVRVVYEPQKNSSTLCSQHGIQIEDEKEVGWWKTVSVD